MATHGVLDARFNLGTTANYGDLYSTIFNFLTGSQAQSLGIQRIAYNTGSAAAGTGIDYTDTVNKVGANAWSCWLFMSATIPFYMLLQGTYGVAFGTAPGNPGTFFNLTNNATVAFATAFLGNGATGSNGPWNGTTNNNGVDNKGAIVWKTGSTGNIIDDMLHVFPRSNSGAGTYAALKQSTVPIGWYDQTVLQRLNFVCDENNILFVVDPNNVNNYTCTYFGKYVPRSGSVAKPYVMLQSTIGNTNYNTLTDTTQVHGTAAGSQAVGEGGIAIYPTPTDKTLSAISGTAGVVASTINEAMTTVLQPNIMSGSQFWDEWPIFLTFYELPWWAGYAGYVDWVRSVFNVTQGDTNGDLTRAFFAVNTAVASYRKISMPWDGITVPGTGLSRTGSIF
jgi:hypothetical protein